MFHRLDPISKFIWVICTSILTIRYENALGQAVLLLAVVLTGFLGVRLTPRSLWRGIRFPFWFGLPYFALQLLFVPGSTELIRWGPYQLTTEATDYAAAISIRLLTLVMASLLFVISTDPRDIVLALAQKLRVPYRFAFAISIALRFLPILEDEAEIVRAAQRLRGVSEPKGVRSKLAWYRRFAYAVFAGAAHRVQRIAEAMENKAFGAYAVRTYRRALIVPAAGSALWIASSIVTISILIWF